MYPDALDGLYLQGLPPQGGLSADGATDAGTIQRGVVPPTPGGGYAGGGAEYDQDLHHSLSEKNFPIYCDSSDTGAVSGGGVAPRGTDPQSVVGMGGYVMVGCKGVNEGGRGCRGGKGEGIV